MGDKETQYVSTERPLDTKRHSSADRHSRQPDHSRGDMNESGEVGGAAIVACSEAAEMLEAAKASLDPVAVLVDGCVVRNEGLAITLRGDDRFGLHGGDPST